MAWPALLLAAIAVQPAAGSAPPTTAAVDANHPDRRQLEELNRQWFEAYRTKNADLLGAILAEDFAGDYGSGAVRTKRQMVQSLADPNRAALDIQSDQVAVHLFGDTAMVTGRSITKAVRDGKPVESMNRYADIYMRRAGKWVAVAAHVVRVPGQP